eukprot:26713-Prymnesium_polylepis.2
MCGERIAAHVWVCRIDVHTLSTVTHSDLEGCGSEPLRSGGDHVLDRAGTPKRACGQGSGRAARQEARGIRMWRRTDSVRHKVGEA